MTYPDQNRFPPSAPPGRPQPHTDARSYGHDAPRYDAFGQAPRYDTYGQAPWAEPYPRDAHRHGADLTALRSAYRLLRRTSALAALGSFVVYVLLSCWAPGLMGSKIAGELSLGMALGVLQLVVTFAAVFWYGRSARRSVDPLARAVKERAVPTARDARAAR
ncbi:DUF485 domain-containing protein [Streptomyces sp. NPDC093984]|uniref:DUF485 domain-containing protein n=1 Tax=Streptomyces sp. NPDC093984 TaxID=3366052 RepID=UPI00382F3012